MSYLVVGMSHRSAPVELLERAALGRAAVTKVLDDVHESDHLAEAVVVATCNRVELYVDAATFHGGVDEATALIAQHGGVPREDLVEHLYVHYEDRAVSHLFTVVSGLDSMVVGESQILGQVRDAFRLAQTSDVTGRVLGDLFSTALRVGKRAHAETAIDAAGRSLVTVGLAEVAPDGVAGRRVLVVGAGSMAALAVTTLARAGAAVAVASRTYERARRLAESVDGSALSMTNVAAALADADLVVSCTGAAGTVLGRETLAGVMHDRDGRALGVLDLAMPRDVDPAARDLDGLSLVDLETINTIADAAAPAEADIASVREIIAAELAGFADGRRQARVAPTVIALRTMADDVVEAELSRLRGRLPDVDERTEAEIASTVRRVVDKLLHEPTVRVKELASSPGGASYELALRELFALDSATIEAICDPAIQDLLAGPDENAPSDAVARRIPRPRAEGGSA
jgi:glutamyl-tRNA reductase